MYDQVNKYTQNVHAKGNLPSAIRCAAPAMFGDPLLALGFLALPLLGMLKSTNYSEQQLNKAVVVMAINGALTAILLKIALPVLGGTITGTIVFGFNLFLMIAHSLFIRAPHPGITYHFSSLTCGQKTYFSSIILCNIIGSLIFYHAAFANSVSAIILGFAFIITNIVNHSLNVLFLGGKMNRKNKIGVGITLGSIFWIMISDNSGFGFELPRLMLAVSMLFLGMLPFLKKKLFNSLALTHPEATTQFFAEEGIIKTNYLFGFITFIFTFWIFGSGVINPASLSVGGIDLVTQIISMQYMLDVMSTHIAGAICATIAGVLFISIWLIDLKVLSTSEKHYRFSNYLIIGSLRATFTTLLSCVSNLVLPVFSVVIAVIASLYGAWYGSSNGNNSGVLKSKAAAFSPALPAVSVVPDFTGDVVMVVPDYVVGGEYVKMALAFLRTFRLGAQEAMKKIKSELGPDIARQQFRGLVPMEFRAVAPSRPSAEAVTENGIRKIIFSWSIVIRAPPAEIVHLAIAQACLEYFLPNHLE
ncbi:MAG: hypothetical protein NT060_04075, partial [Candidatus Omnitrophica bacterium]|nr:hypothetical protein [Candidatus Omnitrophota bacterium]